MFAVLNNLGRQPRWVIAAHAVIINLVVAVVDYLSGYEFAFSIFYLAGVGLAAWLLGRHWGLGLAALSTALWILADQLAGHIYAQPWIPYWNAAVRCGFFVIVSQSIAAQRAALALAESLARIDALTGVANRRAFLEAAAAEIDRARRYGTSLALAFIDVDNFKALNDSLGHATGDAMLITLARTMRTTLRGSDVVGRLGGDEFAIVLPHLDYLHASAAIERIRCVILDAVRRHGWPVGFSIGAVTWAVPPASVDELLSQADSHMYSIKHGSKNAIRHEAVPAPDEIAVLGRSHTNAP